MTSILHTKEQGQRLHKLANLGGLVAIAQLEEIEPAVLLGAFIEFAHQFPAISMQQINALRGSGLQRLRERNTAKRIYKQQKASSEQSDEIALNVEIVKKIIIQLGGKIPVFEKDILPELLRLIRR